MKLLFQTCLRAPPTCNNRHQINPLTMNKFLRQIIRTRDDIRKMHQIVRFSLVTKMTNIRSKRPSDLFHLQNLKHKYKKVRKITNRSLHHNHNKCTKFTKINSSKTWLYKLNRKQFYSKPFLITLIKE